MKPPIFIIGTARSGTTLLCRMLSAHPNLYIKNEIPGVQHIFKRNAAEDEIILHINQAMNSFYGFSPEAFLLRENKQRWGLKDPELTYCLDCLMTNFVDSKVIFIQRDGRAVVNSYLQSKWGLGTNVYTGAIRWVNEIEKQRSFFEAYPKRCYWIKYEDLLTKTQDEIDKLLAFLDEPFSQQVLEYYKQPSYIQNKPQSTNTFKKLDLEIASSWKKNLNQKQIDIIETIAGDTLTNYGYHLAGTKIEISSLKKIFYKFHQKIIGELQLQYRLKIAKKINQKR
jgi:hypothetical protein